MKLFLTMLAAILVGYAVIRLNEDRIAAREKLAAAEGLRIIAIPTSDRCMFRDHRKLNGQIH